MDNKIIDEAVKAEQRAYMKEWRAKNKDRVRRNNQNYWKNRALKKLQANNEKEQ